MIRLMVRAGVPNSHSNCGWQQFTDTVIRFIFFLGKEKLIFFSRGKKTNFSSKLNNESEGLVYLLWGAFAKKKGKLIEKSKHTLLEHSHPSPMSGNSLFFFLSNFFFSLKVRIFFFFLLEEL